MPFNLVANQNYFKKISIFQNQKHFYFIGTHISRNTYSLFTFSKYNYNDIVNYGFSTNCNYKSNYMNIKDNKNTKTSLDLNIKDLIVEYKEKSIEEFEELNNNLSKDMSTNLRYLVEAKAIFGFFKLTLGYYVILVTEISQVGKLGSHIVNRIDKVRILPLFVITDDKLVELESKYLSIFKDFLICNQTYFSYTYDLSKSVQRNFVEAAKNSYSNSDNNDFYWNHYHMSYFESLIDNKLWINHYIYGFFEQINCYVYGLRFYVTIIARRNRHFAGTRYLKRGISDEGYVGNDVETEQILEEVSTSTPDTPIISSYVHIRGSVPIYWYQIKNKIMPKPDIKINYSDVFCKSTKLHFKNLIERYGHPIIACNLTKKKENYKQETLLNECYSTSIHYINNEIPENEYKLTYFHFDLKHERKDHRFYHKFFDISQSLIESTGMFGFIPNIRSERSFKLLLQSGIIRSNCVDCLDRTNVFQQFIGTAVMYNQLRLMNIDLKVPVSNEESEMFGVLTSIYKRMGHVISSQYAGSEAHKQSIQETRTKIEKLLDKIPEFLNTFKRYLNNSWNDTYKQMCINLFLGKFKPYTHKYYIDTDLWKMPNDLSLHKRDPFDKLNLEEEWWKKSYIYYKKYSLLAHYEIPYSAIKLEPFQFKLQRSGSYNININNKFDSNIDNNISSSIVLPERSLNKHQNIVYLDMFQKLEIMKRLALKEKKRLKNLKSLTVKNDDSKKKYNINLMIDKKNNITNYISKDKIDNINSNNNIDNDNNNNSKNTNIENKIIKEIANDVILVENPSSLNIDKQIKDYTENKNNIIDNKEYDKKIVNMSNPYLTESSKIDVNYSLINNPYREVNLDDLEDKIYNTTNYKPHVPFMFLDIDPKVHIKSFKVTNYYDKYPMTKKSENNNFNSALQNTNKAKYDLLFPLDIEETNINITSEFIEPNINNEYYKELDNFVTCDIKNNSNNKCKLNINKHNSNCQYTFKNFKYHIDDLDFSNISNNVFDNTNFADDKNIIDKSFNFCNLNNLQNKKAQIYNTNDNSNNNIFKKKNNNNNNYNYNNNCNLIYTNFEFVEDLKKQNKRRKHKKFNLNEDYIIYDYCKKQYYKKINAFGGLVNNMFNLSGDKSPKIPIKHQKLAYKVLDNYIV